jgi:hypothetical protein
MRCNPIGNGSAGVIHRIETLVVKIIGTIQERQIRQDRVEEFIIEQKTRGTRKQKIILNPKSTHPKSKIASRKLIL